MSVRSWVMVAVIGTVFGAELRAQGCAGQGNAQLGFTPAILGNPFTATLSATPGVPFVWYVDSAPGQIPIPGVGTICLGVTPDLLLLSSSFAGGPSIPPGGTLPITFTLPSDPQLFALPLFSQFAAFDAAAPNGVALSTPASLQFSASDTHVSALGTMSAYRGLHTATPIGSGRYVLLAGGGSGVLLAPTPVAGTDLYDHYTRTFLPGPTMAVPRVLHTATTLQDGRILITGGLDGIAVNNWSDGEVYDPATNTFTPVANLMSSPRAAHTATLLPNGKVLIAGGNTIFAVSGPNNYIQVFQSAVASTDLYDPVTNTFTPGPNLPGPRMGHEAVRLPNGRVLLAGGISGAINLIITALPTYTNVTSVYDPVTNTFSSTGNIANGRLKPLLYVLPSGTVFMGGGAAGTTLATTASVELRNPTTGAWSAGPSLPQPVALAASDRFPDGSFVVQGGGQGALAQFSPIGDVYRYTEGSGFAVMSALPVPLMNHSLTRVGDGTFLLAGGVDPLTITLNTALIWTR